VQPSAGAAVDGLEAALTAELGRWFAGPLLRTDAAGPDERRLAAEIMQRAQAWPPEWPTGWTDVGGVAHGIALDRWRGLQRVLSKQSWFGPPATAIRWPLVEGAPAVVAFYSFKGGVGRTTTLARVAWALAQRGKNVVCVDLDLEAPGLASYLGAGHEPALLDALLTHAATGVLPSGGLAQTTLVHGQRIDLVAAGGLGRGYLEKLARLDYIGASTEDQSPVARALRAVLGRLRAQRDDGWQPDLILLDCRAGLHDLGGLSLTDLAHVDVLVGRDTPQNHDGLSLTLELITRRRPAAERRVMVVQSFVPVEREAARVSLKRMRQKLKTACDGTIYAGLPDVPGEDADEVPHAALPLVERNDIAAAERLADIEAASIATGGIDEIVSRLLALSAPEEP
jgi:MinD-like ATPase involved in chromosome partitioning or flagellar assembly